MIPRDAKPKNVDLTISNRLLQDGSIRITVKDSASSIPFLEFDMEAKMFLEMMRGRGDSEAKGVIISMDKVGKNLEHQKLEFPIPNDHKNSNVESLRELSKPYIPEGWISDGDFESKDSFFTREGGQRYARTTIRRWV